MQNWGNHFCFQYRPSWCTQLVNLVQNSILLRSMSFPKEDCCFSVCQLSKKRVPSICSDVNIHRHIAYLVIDTAFYYTLRCSLMQNWVHLPGESIEKYLQSVWYSALRWFILRKFRLHALIIIDHLSTILFSEILFTGNMLDWYFVFHSVMSFIKEVCKIRFSCNMHLSFMILRLIVSFYSTLNYYIMIFFHSRIKYKISCMRGHTMVLKKILKWRRKYNCFISIVVCYIWILRILPQNISMVNDIMHEIRLSIEWMWERDVSS